MTKKFAKELSLYGLTIVSGMAEGIDGLAHSASIETQGKTKYRKTAFARSNSI